MSVSVLISAQSADTYDAWIAGYGLSGSNAAQTANPDGDQLDNLYEYGLDGNPTNSADAGQAPISMLRTVDGANCIEYVHLQRSSPISGVEYVPELTTNLISGAWTNSGCERVGTAPVDSSFNSITNRVPTQDANQKFVRLKVNSVPITLADRQQTVADFIVASYVTNLPGAEEGGFLMTLPSGETKGGNLRLDLKYTYWVQNNGLYAMVALQPFYPDMALELERSYNYYYTNTFSAYSDQTQHWLTVGVLPSIAAPPTGQYYRSSPVVVTLSAPGPEGEPIVVGTEIHDGTFGTIPADDPRILFKYGVLQNHLAGSNTAAVAYFQQALTLWSDDNQGFVHPKMTEHGAYYARDLAYALICDKAVPGVLSTELRNTIRNRLWTICWDPATGGVWTNYNPDGTIPNFAKQTHEISSLTLLAYRSDIW